MGQPFLFLLFFRLLGAPLLLSVPLFFTGGVCAPAFDRSSKEESISVVEQRLPGSPDVVTREGLRAEGVALRRPRGNGRRLGNRERLAHLELRAQRGAGLQ